MRRAAIVAVVEMVACRLDLVAAAVGLILVQFLYLAACLVGDTPGEK